MEGSSGMRAIAFTPEPAREGVHVEVRKAQSWIAGESGGHVLPVPVSMKRASARGMFIVPAQILERLAGLAFAGLDGEQVVIDLLRPLAIRWPVGVTYDIAAEYVWLSLNTHAVQRVVHQYAVLAVR